MKFRNQYFFLSNFFPAPVRYEGILYPTSEHAYAAAKTLDLDLRRQIAKIPTPGKAKRFCRTLALRPGWLAMRLRIMDEVLTAKFSQHPDLAARLAATGYEELVEENTWGDTFWGVCDGHGLNNLGKALMRVRRSLRSRRPEARPSPLGAAPLED